MGKFSGYLPLSLGLGVLAATPALADVREGVQAWARGEYAAAVKEWQGPAQKGDADAQFNLGQAYKLGRGVKPDLARAEELFGAAASRGHLQAADNLGLLLFQRGERGRAMPFIRAAASRGDPRAQYLLGLAHFNGENVPKDWVRAYALVSLAQQSGLAQAAPALQQMDEYIPLDQRQQSVALATEIATNAEATRQRQVAAADLGVVDPAGRPVSVAVRTSPGRDTMGRPAIREPAVSPEQAAVTAAAARGSNNPRDAGADYTRPRVPQVATILENAPVRAAPTELPPLPPPVVVTFRPMPQARPVAVAASAPRAPVGASSAGAWRVQLGAFGVPANAEAMWARVRGRPEVAGHARINAPAGRVIKLQAGGYASQADAQSACRGLSSAGFDCLAVKD